MNKFNILLTIILGISGLYNLNAQPGEIDYTFNYDQSGLIFEEGANQIVYASAIQSDGKIIIVGNFTTYNGVEKNKVARLNTDGTLDITFNSGTDLNVRTVSIQSDGKIIIGGSFTSYNGVSANRIARLNIDGTLDNSFNTGTGVNGYVFSSAIQSDGKIIIAGDFSSYNGVQRMCIARINSDGSLDNSFDTGTGVDDKINTLLILNDGKIFIGGDFTLFNNEYYVNHIARLNSDGTLDGSFNGSGTNGYSVYSSSLQSDGKIIIGGNFTSVCGITNNRIARLNEDGTPDLNFNSGTGANSTIFSTSMQVDGKIIIGGVFSSYNETTINGIARINSDGTLDNTFNPGTGTTQVYTISIQIDGKIIFGGNFTSFNEMEINRVARLIGDNLNSIENNAIKNENIRTYPNPTSNELIIEIVGNTEKSNFEILNILGKVVCKGSFIEKINVQTSNFESGIYLIKIENGKASEYRKIIKE